MVSGDESCVEFTQTWPPYSSDSSEVPCTVSVFLGVYAPNTTRTVSLRFILNSISDALYCGGMDYCIETRTAGSCKKSPQNQGRFLYSFLTMQIARSFQLLPAFAWNLAASSGRIWLVLLAMKAPYSLMWLHSSWRKNLCCGWQIMFTFRDLCCKCWLMTPLSSLVQSGALRIETEYAA